MKVTLKQAAAYSKALLAVSIPISYEKEVSAYRDGEIPLFQMQVDFQNAVVAAITAKEAGYSIRRKIAIANEGQINDLINKRAALSSHLSLLSSIKEQEPSTQEDLNTLREAIKEGKIKDRYNTATTSFTVRVETEPFIAPLRKDTKRELRKVEDELARLNFVTQIEITPEEVKVLEQYEIL